MEFVIEKDFGSFKNIHLNRPSALNSLNEEMISVIRNFSTKTDKKLIFSGEGRAFCAGGDIVGLSKQSEFPANFFKHEFCLFYDIFCLPQETISILDGITMGGGVGLSMACKNRVLTNKTLWAMPETAIGFVPDVGASYFLNKLCTSELGLYLSLTGQRLRGLDCYFAGLSSFFIPDLDANKREKILKDGINAINTYSIQPDSLQSQLLLNLPLIQQCFDTNFDPETICNRLASINND